MATNPVRKIRRRHLGHAFNLALDGAIDRIAALEPSLETPYLTATVNWLPEGTNPARVVHEPLKVSQRGRIDERELSSPFRPARIELEAAGNEALAGYAPRTPARESLEADLKRLFTYLESELEPEASGAIVVANHGAGVFVTVPLGLPVETTLAVGPTPAIRPLVRIAEDNEPYAVLASAQQRSTLTFFVQHQPLDELSVRASDYPRKQATGGWSQRSFQARAEERIDAYARVVAEEVRQALRETGVEKLVVGGAEVMMSALDAFWHDEVRDLLLETIRVAPDATPLDLAAQVYPIVTAREREDELAAVEQAEAAIGQQELGRAGAEAVAVTLARGQVDTLVINDDFTARGWIDPAYNLAGVGDPPAEHPAGGDPAALLPVELGDELIRMALRTGAYIEVVHSRPEDAPSLDGDGAASRSEAAKRLDALGGVAAVLRFSVLPRG